MKYLKYFFILQNLCVNVLADDYKNPNYNLAFASIEEELSNDDDFSCAMNYENKNIENKILEFLQENEEMNALLQMKVSCLASFLRNFIHTFIEGSLKVDINLLGDEISVPLRLKLSNVLRSLQINNVLHNDHLAILEENGNEVVKIACSKIKDGIKYTYLNHLFSLIEFHMQNNNLSLDDQVNLYCSLEVEDLKNDLEILSLKGTKNINLSVEELNCLLRIKENVPKKKTVLDKGWYDMFDITASVIPSYVMNDEEGVYYQKNLSVTVDLFHIIQYGMKSKDKKFFKALEKTYKDIKKDNEIRCLMYLVNSSYKKLKNLDVQRQVLVNYKTNAELLVYLQCEKEYFQEIVKYAGYILDIKDFKSEIGYYVYEVMKNAK